MSLSLFIRGLLKNSFMCVGQIDSSTLLLPPGTLYNYFFVEQDNQLALSFNPSGSFIELEITATPQQKFVLSRKSDSFTLALSGGNLVFSNLLPPYHFTIKPFSNIPMTQLYTGAWYTLEIPNITFEVPSVIEDLIGDGANGYLTTSSATKNFILNSLRVSFLQTSFYDINGVSNDDIFSRYLMWINNPLSYYNSEVAEWITGNYINSYSESFTTPMLWYEYCNSGNSCGNCYGTVIYGGVQCTLNSQVPKPTITSPTLFNGLPFLATGVQGIPGIQGEKGPRGLQGTPGAPGPQGLRGDSIGERTDKISWYSPPALTFFGLLFLSVAVFCYVAFLRNRSAE